MAFKVITPNIICIFFMLLLEPRLSAGYATKGQYFKVGMERFGNSLFAQLCKNYPNKNIIISPFSIQTSLTMARMDADGQTADELDQVLALYPQNPRDLANNYHAILAKYMNSNVLKVANKIYVMAGYSVRDTFNRLLTEKFYSNVDSINFANNREAAHTINSWVEANTNNKIKDIVDPGMLDAATRLVLVNAIHFKGSWVHPFAEHGTREMDFFLDHYNKIKVEMMYVKKNFKYGELHDLDAKAVELPYKDCDMSMLIIVPNKVNGLIQLERKLKYNSLDKITQRMRFAEIVLNMPKFKAEFEAELSEPLSKMGLERMFSTNAEFGKLLKSAEGLKVSAVVHKAFIEVDENGTEAAAATAVGVSFRSLEFYEEPSQIITADRPFYYVLKNSDNLTLFKGTYKNNL